MSTLSLTVAADEVDLSQPPVTLTASVTNTGTTPERTVLGAFATPGSPSARGPSGSPAAWTTIDRPLREIPPGQTEQFALTIAPPPGTPAGRHPIRLIAYSATQAPEENADQARSITLVVAGAEPAPAARSRPWWLLAVVAALVVVAAVVGVVLVRGRGEPTAAPTTQPTTTVSVCKPGLVPRLTRPEDLVCVTPAVAKRVVYENDAAVQKARKNDPPGGPYGPDTCRVGYVWRDAFPGDHVCVEGSVRTSTAQENRDAAGNAA